MSGQELFVEIGVEELPVSYIEPAIAQFATLLSESLSGLQIDFGEVATFATPRRLGFVIADVADKGRDREIEMVGPPVRVAFDQQGNPLLPAHKFAQKLGRAVEAIKRKQTPKGEYLVAQQIEVGIETVKHLNQVLPEIMAKLSFPKVMRWGAEKTPFARPIHWICALFGHQPLSFSFASVQSGISSRGHRFLAPEPFVVENYAQFRAECRQRYVLIDPVERQQLIAEQGRSLAQSVGGKVWEDEELCKINAYLVEYPQLLLAAFEDSYLSLPKELLRTTMRQHLKCFVVVDQRDEILPYFIAVSNLPVQEGAKVQHGYQRVLRARLADARFFYDEDRNQPLDHFVSKLDKVVYQTKLGSYGDKVRRVCTQIPDVAKEIGLESATALAQRAAQIYKSDLASEMVFEFPELQGIMGKYYALHGGEDPEVAEAIREHYLPAGQDDALPQTEAGRILAIAERLDTLLGGFAVGLQPTGSADPYGLRRQAIGLLRILREHRLSGRLSALLEIGANALGERLEQRAPVVAQVLEYLQGRLVQILRGYGWPRDLVDAACTVDLIARYPLHQMDNLLSALQDAVRSGLLAGVAYSFKRVNNILRAAAKKAEIAAYHGLGTLTFCEEPPAVEVSLLEAGSETALFDTYNQVQEQVENALKCADFASGLNALLTLREPIDKLFDTVMVMAEEPKLRANRLSLMRGIARLAFLDFSRIDTDEATKI
jgi:glycyl-tRNA synthetase beta chain